MLAYNPEYYKKHKAVHDARTAEYHKQHTRFIGIRLNTVHDFDVLAKLDQVHSKVGYIKQLIREDIQRTGFDPGPKPRKKDEPPHPDELPPVEPVPTVTLPPVEPVPTVTLPPVDDQNEILRKLGF